MTTNRININTIKNSQFYQLPKFLFNENFIQMSNDARVAYSLLRDRHDLSIVNNWVDENGHVFLIFSRKNMETMLNKSDKTITKIFKELVTYDLLDDVRMGQSIANRIYIKEISTIFLKSETVAKRDAELNRKNSESETRNFSDSGVGKTTSPESEKLRPNDTDLNQTEFSDTKQSINQDNNTNSDGLIENVHGEKYTFEFLQNTFGIDHIDIANNEFYDQALFLLHDVMNSHEMEIKLSKSKTVSTDVFIARMLKLKRSHFVYVDETIQNQKTEIRNMRSYLLTSLYNSLTTMGSYYSNRVNSEM